MVAKSLPVLIFAAGFGTRMKALTQDRPKPMIPVAGRPMIDHALDLVRETNPPKIVANLHYKPEQLRNHLEQQGVTCLLEWPEILETGGGLRNALPLLGSGPVITMNSDAIWAGPNPLSLLLSRWNPDEMDGLLVGIPVSNAQGHHGTGDFTCAADGSLTRGPGLIYGGVQVIKTDLFSKITDTSFSLNRVWDIMLQNGRLKGVAYGGQWCDVGHPEGIVIAEQMLEQSNV